MAVMTINYGSSSIVDRANKLANAFSDAANEISSIRGRVRQLPESQHNNIHTSSAFLQKKREQYDRSAAKLSSFARSASLFMQQARETDERVGQNIKDAYKAFHKATGIGTSVVAFWVGKVWDGIKSVGTALTHMAINAVLSPLLLFGAVFTLVKKLYDALPEKWKYILKCVVSAVGIVVAVIGFVAALYATGGAALPYLMAMLKAAGGLIGMVTATAAFSKDFSAVFNAYAGYEEDAKRISDMSAGEYVGGVTKTIWDGADVEFVENVYNVTDMVGGLLSVTTFGIEGIDDIAGLVKDGKAKNMLDAAGKWVQGEFATFLDVLLPWDGSVWNIDRLKNLGDATKLTIDIGELCFDLSDAFEDALQTGQLKPGDVVFPVLDTLPILKKFTSLWKKGGNVWKGITLPAGIDSERAKEREIMKGILYPKITIPVF